MSECSREPRSLLDACKRSVYHLRLMGIGPVRVTMFEFYIKSFKDNFCLERSAADAKGRRLHPSRMIRYTRYEKREYDA